MDWDEFTDPWPCLETRSHGTWLGGEGRPLPRKRGSGRGRGLAKASGAWRFVFLFFLATCGGICKICQENLGDFCFPHGSPRVGEAASSWFHRSTATKVHVAISSNVFRFFPREIWEARQKCCYCVLLSFSRPCFQTLFQHTSARLRFMHLLGNPAKKDARHRVG